MLDKLLLTFFMINLFLISPSIAQDVIMGWGNNSSNQIIPLILEENIKDIDAGPNSTCFIDESGLTQCKGCENPLKNFGQCSTEKIPDNWTLQYGGMRTTEKPMENISTTFAASCGINIDGEVECWGCKPPRQNFQCNIPDNVNKIKAKISKNPLKGLRTINLSDTHTCVILDNGEVECWGCEEPENFGQCSPPKNLNSKGISSGPEHTCSVSEDNVITCWGRSKANVLKTPIVQENIRQIVSGYRYNAILLESGKIQVWGDNSPKVCSNAIKKDCIDLTKRYEVIYNSNDYFCMKDISNNLDCLSLNKGERLESISVRKMYGWLNGKNVKHLSLDNGVSVAIIDRETYEVNKSELPSAKKILNPFEYMSSRERLPPTEAYKNSEHDFSNFIGIKFKAIQSGKFKMGGCSTKWECLFSGYNPDDQVLSVEKPIHTVNIPKDFQISVFEITVADFKHYISDMNLDINKYEGVLFSEEHYPVSVVSWYDAKKFVKWLNDKKPSSDKGIYRLPTESEWEYVTKAGSKTRFPNGDHIKNLNIANCIDCLFLESPGPLPVGSFPPNAWGLYDTLGNVDEWVEDCMNLEGYKGHPNDGSAYISEDCNDRVVRGGSWEYPSETLRSTWRDWYPPEDKTWEQGFRIVRELP